MTTILALDSAIGISSVAVWRAGEILAYCEDTQPGMQAAKLVPLIEQTLEKSGVNYSQLSHIACTTGPGSFTGIRISLSAARAIAYALNIPPLGFTTLEVMASATGTKNSVAMVNAGKGEVYYQRFGKDACEATIAIMAEVLANTPPDCTIASAMPLPAGFAAPIITHPRADALAMLAATRLNTALSLVPFYIRPPDAKPQVK